MATNGTGNVGKITQVTGADSGWVQRLYGFQGRFYLLFRMFPGTCDFIQSSCDVSVLVQVSKSSLSMAR